jgi:dihydroflavonol-4-reductase
MQPPRHKDTKTSPSKKILVTGGTGFLGKHLLDYLKLKKEKSVRVLTTSAPSWLEDSGFEIIEGSITSPDIVKVAVENVQQIYHLAGKVSRTKEDPRDMHAIHVDGTRLLCEAAKAAGVQRMVLASSSGTIAITEDGFEIPDESWPAPVEIITKFPYYSSKWYQERTATKSCGDAIDLIILNPSLLLGPGDERLSSTQDVLKFIAGDIPAIPSGGINFVDVRDAAVAFYTAMQRGKPGERYLLGGPNWTLDKFFGHLERITKVKAPRIKVHKKLHSVTSKLIEGVFEGIGKEPPVEPVSMEMSRYYWYVDSSKAKRELGFVSRDPGETLFDTVEYLRKNFLGAGVFD